MVLTGAPRPVLDKAEADVVCDYIRQGGRREAFLERFGAARSPGFDPDVHLERIGLANQTTMLMSESLEIGEMFRMAMVDRWGEDALADHFRAFDTICSATQERQDAVVAILKEQCLDLMVVVGGYNSSNTCNLANICAERVPTYHVAEPDCLVSERAIRHRPVTPPRSPRKAVAEITTAGWLPIDGPVTVGLTAGASTPNNIIGEVIDPVYAERFAAWLHKAGDDEQFVGLWMARAHHKTTLNVVWIIQDILRDPNVALFYFHAVDAEAEKVVSEVAHHLQTNKRLRALDPIGTDSEGNPWRYFPHQLQKKFAKTDQFTLNRPPTKFRRWATLLGKGAGSEITGAHADKAYLDDIIGRRTIEDSMLPKIASWYRNTVLPVVDGMVVRASGTPWSDTGLYADWWTDRDWRVLVIPGSTDTKYKALRANLTRIEQQIEREKKSG